MVSVFSFCLFGDTDKYCVGLLNNIKTIFEKFPGWMVYVYVGEGVPHWILSQLQRIPIVRIIQTNMQGNENKAWRFFAVDLPEVDVCIVRDSDSRVYDRDQAAIQEFLQSDKEFHIIRDHPNHFHKIMAGMWGAKKGMFANTNMQELYTVWRQQRIVRGLTPDFWDDTTFLIEMIYPNVVNYSLIHDTLHHFEPDTMRTEIKAPIGDGLNFVGQVYEYDENGNEYPKYRDYFNPQR
jgi:hypothetical protein